MSSSAICQHCGEPIMLSGELTQYYPCWSEYNAEASIDPDTGRLVVEDRWGPRASDGDTERTEIIWTRTCCYEPLTAEEYKEWNLNDSAIFLD